MPKPMSPSEVDSALIAVAGWASVDAIAITRTFTYADHITAMSFVNRVAMVAEAMDHHPDLRIVYNRVEIRLNSHDANGVTVRDIRLAEKINQYA